MEDISIRRESCPLLFCAIQTECYLRVLRAEKFDLGVFRDPIDSEASNNFYLRKLLLEMKFSTQIIIWIVRSVYCNGKNWKRA